MVVSLLRVLSLSRARSLSNYLQCDDVTCVLMSPPLSLELHTQPALFISPSAPSLHHLRTDAPPSLSL
jgi:hypothetical protein